MLKTSDFFTERERALYTFTDPNADPGPDIRIRTLRAMNVRLSRTAVETEHVEEGAEVVIPFAFGMELVRHGSAVLLEVAAPLRAVR